MCDHSGRVWAGLILSGAAYEMHGFRRGHGSCMLSPWTRKAFRVDTKAGKALFLVGELALALWFARHITGVQE